MELKKMFKKEQDDTTKSLFDDDTNMFSFDDDHEMREEEDSPDLTELVSEIQKKLEDQTQKDKKPEPHGKGHAHKETLAEKQKRAKLEEERYDQLLNSVQAQNLIKTVDQLNQKEKVEKNHAESRPQNTGKTEHVASHEAIARNQKAAKVESENMAADHAERVEKNRRKSHLEELLHKHHSMHHDLSAYGEQMNEAPQAPIVTPNIVNRNSDPHSLDQDVPSRRDTEVLQHYDQEPVQGYHPEPTQYYDPEPIQRYEQESIQRDTGRETSRRFYDEDQSVKEDPLQEIRPESMEVVDTRGFQRGDIHGYISSQCEVMEEATSHIDEAMEEYSDVTEYFTDIQKIEQAPDAIKKQVETLAKRVNDLAVDRRISKAYDNKLSSSAYHRMEQLEEEIPRGFQYIKKQESYYETVKRDMRILEAEQLNMRLEARMLTKRQLKIRTFSIATVIGLGLAFIVFIIALGVVSEDDSSVYYILVALIGAIIAVGLFALLKYTERQVLVTEIKLNKATNLLNKTKIKYINAANTLDYEYSKYRVRNSYELEKKYQAYIEMKEEQKKVLSMTTILNEAEEDLENALNRLNLYDTHVWIGQVKALYNPKEMVEVRHDLTVQRQKLRNLIEYNEQRIEEAKRNIKNITVKHPEYTQTALTIIGEYEAKNRK